MNWEVVLLRGCKGQLLTRRRQASASLPLCAGHILFYMMGQTMFKEPLLSHQIPSTKKNASLWIGLLPSEMLVWTEERVADRVCLPNALSENVAVVLNFCYFVWQSVTMNGYTSCMYRERNVYACIFIVLGLNMVVKSWGTMTFVRLNTTCLCALQSCVLWARTDLRISKRCGTCPSHRKGMADGIAHGNAKHSWGCLSLKCLDFINWIISSTPANYHPAVFDDKMKCIEMLTPSFCIICTLASSLHKHKQSRSAVKTFQTSTLSHV